MALVTCDRCKDETKCGKVLTDCPTYKALWKTVKHLVEIEDALDGGKETFANQGQAMDGISALANFRDIAQTADEYWKMLPIPAGEK